MSSLTDKFNSLADGLQKSIDNARRPMTQNPTPKRMREYHSRVLNGDNLERGQRALRCLAELRRRPGKWSDEIVVLATLKSKAEIVDLVRHRLDSSGYYDIHDTGKYANTSPVAVALQNLLDHPDSKTAEQIAADADRQQEQKTKRMEDELRFATIPGFFPTPAPLALRMVEMADIQDHHWVLEPSAGLGTIAEIIKIFHPDIFLDGDQPQSLRNSRGEGISSPPVRLHGVAGQRVFGDDGPDAPGQWYEIHEATHPNANGIDVTTTIGKTARIYSYNSTPEKAKSFDIDRLNAIAPGIVDLVREAESFISGFEDEHDDGNHTFAKTWMEKFHKIASIA